MKAISKYWFWAVTVVLLATVFGLIAWQLWWGVHRLPVMDRSPAFSLTNMDGKNVTLEGLDNKIKVVTFVFTNCGDACPMTLHYMMEVQDDLKKEGLFGKDVVLMSVTMDPETDTLPVLTDYSKTFNADPSGWMFLRGSREETDKLMEAFKIPAEKLENGQYMHSNKVFLIDGNRNIRKMYDLKDEGSEQILSDLKTLAAE